MAGGLANGRQAQSLFARLQEIVNRFLKQSGPLEMARQLHCSLPGLVPVQSLQRDTHFLVQIGAFRCIQMMIQVVLEEMVAEAIAGEPLSPHAFQRLRPDQPVPFV